MPKFTDSLIGENLEVATEYFKALVAHSNINNKKKSGGSIGFIPFNVNFTMDGISGIKIYNELTLDTSFLPPGYTSTTNFIVTGIDHKLKDGDWETDVKATLIPQTSDIEDIITGSFSINKQTEMFIPPINNTPPPANVAGGGENGKLPESSLKSIGGGHKLAIEAADAYLRMVSDMKAEGIIPQLTDSYRTYEAQNAGFDWDYYVATGGSYSDTSPRKGAKRRKKGTANTAMAFPGTSNHGWGKAIDIFPANVQNWIKKNGVRYGWSWYEGRSVNEDWHFTYDPTKTEVYI